MYRTAIYLFIHLFIYLFIYLKGMILSTASAEFHSCHHRSVGVIAQHQHGNC